MLKVAFRDKDTRTVIIDNHETQGVWDKVYVEVKDEKPKKTVTLTNSVTAAMQINRLSTNSGTENISKAFYSDFNDEVKAFINAE